LKTFNAPKSATTRRILPIASATMLGMAFMVAHAQSAHADQDTITPPSVPFGIQVLPPNRPFLIGHATGTQNYMCLPSGSGFKFKLVTPRATLANEVGKQITTHYFSPNPIEQGVVRATWEHSRDSSIVWGKVVDGDNITVNSDAIDWLRVTVTGTEEGPTGGDTFAHTTFVQRINTVGGLARPEGCSSLADVGAQQFSPYTADYVFYTDQ
jgi:hypothetical protein